MLLGTHSELQIQLCLHLLLLLPWNKGWYIPGMFCCMKVQSQNLSYPSSQASTDTLEQGIVYTRDVLLYESRVTKFKLSQ
jgi:hypothetical protein